MGRFWISFCIFFSVFGFAFGEIREAIATVRSANGTLGTVTFRQEGSGQPVTVSGTLNNLAPGNSVHGLHVHEFGDISSNDCTSAKKHWNPHKMTHGTLDSEIRHIGDLGNVNVSADGIAKIFLQIPAENLPLVGPDSIVGRALIIHQGEDDLGLGIQPDSNSTGHAGSRLGCGVIGISSNFTSATLDPGMHRKKFSDSDRKAIAVLKNSNGSQAFGNVFFVEKNGEVRISGILNGILPNNSKHVLHVHLFGTANCEAAGEIFEDLGNFDVNFEGFANFSAESESFPLVGPKSIIGRTLVLHQGNRDQPGSRLACGVIGIESDFSPADSDRPHSNGKIGLVELMLKKLWKYIAGSPPN